MISTPQTSPLGWLSVNYENTVNVDAPRIAALLICTRAVYLAFSKGGVWTGLISAILTTICVIPLFKATRDTGEEGAQPTPVLVEDNTSPESDNIVQDTAADENYPSRIYMEANEQELQEMRNEEHTAFGRVVHNSFETWTEDLEELLFVVRILQENQGLLLLLSGGITSMVMALVAGLDNINFLKALLVSIVCYGLTTIIVARSARRIVNEHITQNAEGRLSYEEVTKIIETIPNEEFVSNDQLGGCDFQSIERMLSHRGVTVGSENLKKEKLVYELRQCRKVEESCCICLSEFNCGETIRVLPNCNHEFHLACFDQWATTFATSSERRTCHAKQGRPTCPLCKILIGEDPKS